MRPILIPILGLSLLLFGCGDGGGAAGDTGGGPEDTGPSALDPFVGLWDITGNWDGRDADEAYLVIRAPDENNEAAVLLYDFSGDNPNSNGNCYEPPFNPGRLFESEDNRVFMDHFVYNDATVTLSADDQSMTIEFFDTNDINGNGNIDEVLSSTVTRELSIVEVDLQPLCS